MAGCLIIGIGGWLLMDSTKGHLLNLFIANTSPHEAIHSIAVCLLCLGMSLFFIGFFGCRASLQNSQCIIFMVSFKFLFFFLNIDSI